jgi:hypothetical protein
MTKRLRNLLAGAATIGSVVPAYERPPVKTLYAPARSSSDALRGDWKRVGGDLGRALQKAPRGSEAT